MHPSKKPHADHAFDQGLAKLRTLLDTMTKEADRMLTECLQALDGLDGQHAKRVLASDQKMNGLEVAIDDHCLKLLARWQPVASDLRFIATTLKVVTDLERIGDHCVNICDRVLGLSHERPGAPAVDLHTLARTVESMLRAAFAALDAEDGRQAMQVIEHGKQVDALVGKILHDCFDSMRREDVDIHLAVRMYEIAGYLQRIAAHGTNIAEMVVFLARGEDVRHAGRLQPAAAFQEEG